MTWHLAALGAEGRKALDSEKTPLNIWLHEHTDAVTTPRGKVLQPERPTYVEIGFSFGNQATNDPDDLRDMAGRLLMAADWLDRD